LWKQVKEKRERIYYSLGEKKMELLLEKERENTPLHFASNTKRKFFNQGIKRRGGGKKIPIGRGGSRPRIGAPSKGKRDSYCGDQKGGGKGSGFGHK